MSAGMHPSQNRGWQGIRQKLRMHPRARTLLWLAAFGTVVWAKPMGLLLWARLRVLTNLPRTAIADDPASNAAAAEVVPERVLELPDHSESDPFRLRGCRLSIPQRPVAQAELSRLPPKFNPSLVDASLSQEAVDLAALCAERFRVQTAGSGLSCAVINGRTYKLGDELALESLRFLLVEIREAGVILACGDRRFEIKIRSSGS